MGAKFVSDEMFAQILAHPGPKDGVVELMRLRGECEIVGKLHPTSLLI